MRRFSGYIGGGWVALCALMLSLPALVTGEEIRVAWSDPSKPGTVEISLLNGEIKVVGYEGNEVIVVAEGDAIERQRERERNRQESDRAGLRRIGGGMGSFSVEEQNNVLHVNVPVIGGEVNLQLRVPTRTSLKLSCINCDQLEVANVTGTLELKNINGGVRATNVAGSVVAHSLNDDVVVKMASVDAGKAMSFSSMNGDIDVALPAAVKADFVIETHMGEIFTDFEVAMEPNVNRQVNDNRNQGGAFRVKVERNLRGKVNGGGPTIQFKNHNGDVLIRKAKQ